MIAMTTRSSISVNADGRDLLVEIFMLSNVADQKKRAGENVARA
jgi:hypothetical protein